jgi:hypothetical protein
VLLSENRTQVLEKNYYYEKSFLIQLMIFTTTTSVAWKKTRKTFQFKVSEEKVHAIFCCIFRLHKQFFLLID